MVGDLPRLTVCLIAKNEERNIARAIRSLLDVADEIVVTDTGSTDDTVRIAKDLGARVEHFPWIDDFSAAYNHCFDQATGDWVFVLDADEELLESSQKKLLSATQSEVALAYTCLRQDLVEASNLDVFTKMLVTRLFRNRHGIQFGRRIHHDFVPPLQEIAAQTGLALLESTIQIRHYGYTAEFKQAKLERAANLLELELRDRPEQFYYIVELGRTYLALGDSRGLGLITQAAQHVADGSPDVLACRGALAILLEHILASDVLPNDFPLSRRKAIEIARKLFPNSVPLLWQRALGEFKRERFAPCAELLEKILRLGETEQYDMLASFDPDIMSGRAILNLGVCYVRLGKLSKAKECFVRLLDFPSYVKHAKTNLRAIVRLQERMR